MKCRIVNGVTLAVLVAVSACGGSSTEDIRTDETSANLLASVPSQSTDLSGMPTGSLPP